MLGLMAERGWDLFITANYRTVYYFTGLLGNADGPCVFALFADDRSFVMTAAAAQTCLSERIALESYSIERSITEPVRDAAEALDAALDEALGGEPGVMRQVAAERSSLTGLMEDVIVRQCWCEGLEDATAPVLRLRKRKEPDEIDEIRASLRYCAAAYRAARRTIAPGLTELDVYSAMYAEVAREAGSSIAFPGDFACGTRAIRGGGPATQRVLQPRDLYILDLFPAPALYFADTCRTFAVGSATDEQMRAHEIVRKALGMAEEAVRPGVRARDVYWLVKNYLDSAPLAEKSFWHHLGHGIGHHGHEAPRMIPGSEDVFEAGDVIALEPGIYSERIGGGIRLEDNYVVTETGLQNLFDFPMEL
jgi:Xaa-Pro aminopeptidase